MPRHLNAWEKNKASLDAAWHITERAVLSATLLYVGPQVDVNRAGTVTGLTGNQYTLMNLAGSYDLGNGVSAYARIKQSARSALPKSDRLPPAGNWCICRDPGRL